MILKDIQFSTLEVLKNKMTVLTIIPKVTTELRRMKINTTRSKKG